MDRLADTNMLFGDRPYERESAFMRDQPRVRLMVLMTFPLALAVMWGAVPDDARTVFVVATAWTLLANAIAFAVPWARLPRWSEMFLPMSVVASLWLIIAATGGAANVYGALMLVPFLWLAAYADLPDIGFGMALLTLLLVLPLRELLPVLPPQGDARENAMLLVVVATCLIGVRPIVAVLREQARTAHRAVGALHASQAALAHDLRNPLSAMHSLAILIEDRLRDDDADAGREKALEYAGVMRESTVRAGRIIDAVLELTQAGDLLPWVAPIDLSELIADVAFGVPGVDVDSTDAPARIVGHRPSLARLFDNLLYNAATHGRRADAADEQSVLVTINGHPTHDGWIIEITDDGEGFGDTNPALLFEPWRRGTDAGDGGSGLGLTIAAGIAERHGGSLTASASSDGGACFTLSLPRHPPVSPPARTV